MILVIIKLSFKNLKHSATLLVEALMKLLQRKARYAFSSGDLRARLSKIVGNSYSRDYKVEKAVVMEYGFSWFYYGYLLDCSCFGEGGKTFFWSNLSDDYFWLCF